MEQFPIMAKRHSDYILHDEPKWLNAAQCAPEMSEELIDVVRRIATTGLTKPLARIAADHNLSRGKVLNVLNIGTNHLRGMHVQAIVVTSRLPNVGRPSDSHPERGQSEVTSTAATEKRDRTQHEG